MTSTEEATEPLIDLENTSIDAGQATPSQPLSAGALLDLPNSGYNPNHSHSIYDTTGVTRNQASYIPAYRPGANPDGTHAINFPDGGPNTTDINVYQQKKNIAQGMMDLALLSANANQLRYVIEKGRTHPFYWINIVLISISIFIQIVVGFGLVWKSRYNMSNHNDFYAAVRINNLVSFGVLAITIVNVIIASFNIAEFDPKSISTNITVSD